MSLRISSAFGLLGLLAACGATTPEPGGIPMDCAIGAGATLDTACSVYEVKDIAQPSYFVIWHPDGGFRRIRYINTRKAIEVLDGAEPATSVSHLADGSVEFVVDTDRYRLPPAMVSLNDMARPKAR